jgi:hypothetical protein
MVLAIPSLRERKKGPVMSRNSESLQLVDEYVAAGHSYPVQAEQIAAWAIQTRRWEPSTQAALRLCAHQIADGLREAYWTDPKGRRVRAKHSRRDKEGDKQIAMPRARPGKKCNI